MKQQNRAFDPARRQVMAILNLTPDSFYAGSRMANDEALTRHIEQSLAAGATIIDVGGYSSRPDADDVPLEEEWQRVRCGVAAVRRISGDVAVSVDTFRSEVVRRVVEEFGAVVVNDISAGEADEQMISTVAHYSLSYIAMHMRGTPQTMQSLLDYGGDVVGAVCDYFSTKIEQLRKVGIEDIILDPGFGFAKSVEQNFELLAGVNRICSLGYPVLAGVSRKSMIYKTLDVTPEDALNGTTALNWEALRQGATILRVHDVREAVQTIKLYEAYIK